MPALPDPFVDALLKSKGGLRCEINSVFSTVKWYSSFFFLIFAQKVGGGGHGPTRPPYSYGLGYNIVSIFRVILAIIIIIIIIIYNDKCYFLFFFFSFTLT